MRLFLILLLLSSFFANAGIALADLPPDFEPLKEQHPRVLIFAPHPDDDLLGAAGVMRAVVKMREASMDADLRVVYVTLGDSYAKNQSELKAKNVFMKIAEIRHQEALAGLAVIGVTKDKAIFLGYPNRGILRIYGLKDSKEAYFSPMLLSSKVPFPFAFHPGRPFSREGLLADIKEIIREFKPTSVFTPTLTDMHPDHDGTTKFVTEALESFPVKPKHYEYLIHWDVVEPGWPENTKESLTPIRHIKSDLKLTLSDFGWNAEEKLKAIQKHQSQISAASSYLFYFAKNTEQFWIHRPTIGDYIKK